MLLHTGASKSLMSLTHYLRCRLLHSLPRFHSETMNIQVGSGEYASVLFIVPVILNRCEHSFEILTLVEIHENIDILLGMRNIFELEGIINSR